MIHFGKSSKGLHLISYTIPIMGPPLYSFTFLSCVLRSFYRESAENCYVPNAGFLENVVIEDPALFSTLQASDSCEDHLSVGQANAISSEYMGDASAADGTQSIPDPASGEDPTVKNEFSEHITTGMADLQVKEDTSGIESNVDDQNSLSVEDVDLLLDKCLLQALHTTVKDKDLPILGSILW